MSRLARRALLLFLVATCVVTSSVAASPSAPALTPARVDEVLTAGDIAEGEKLARQLVAQEEKRHGARSVEAAAAYQQLAHALFYAGRVTDPELLRLAERVVSIRRQVLGSQHVDVADGLNDLALILSAAGKPLEARAPLEEALAIQRRVLQPDAIEIATTLNNLGSVLWDARDLKGARDGFGQALEILRKRRDVDADTLSAATRNLAAVMYQSGDPVPAQALYREELPKLRARLGPRHPEVATCLNSLGRSLHETWDLDEARTALEEALSIREEALGPDHPHVATSLSNLGLVLLDAGDLAGARDLLERALALDQRVLGPDHPTIAIATANLADVLAEQGDVAAARALLEKAIASGEATRGPENAVVATHLHALGSMLRDDGQLDAARPYLERALAIRRQVLDPHDPTLVPTLSNLGMLLVARGENERARALFEEALGILDTLSGRMPVDRAAVTLNLARLSASEGDWPSALARSESAVGMLRGALGDGHWRVAEALATLAEVRAAMGDAGGAMDAAVESESITRDVARVTCTALSQREALLHASRRSGGLDVALSVAAATDAPRAAERAWTELVRSRALVAEVMAERTALLRGDPGLEQASQARLAAARRLSQLVARGSAAPAGVDPEAELAAARAQLDAAERDMARSASFRSRHARPEDLASLAAALRPGDALLAYARFAQWPTAVDGRRPGELTAKPAYAALVLRRDASARVIPLGAADVIELRVAEWRQAAGEPSADTEPAGEALREAIWDPVGRALGDASRVHVVPDGVLFGVSLAALPDGNGRFLVESGPLIGYLSVERDLVREVTPPASAGFGLLALGDPAFDAAPWAAPPRPALQRALDVASSTIAGLVPRGATSTCGAFEGLAFGPLPDSGRELEELAQSWRALADNAGQSRRVTQIAGRDATEDAFDRLAPAHRFVHVATHGFFVASDCGAARPVGATPDSAPLRQLDESPLLRSGLALAGFNRRADAPAGGADGVLTAEEVSALDLSGVEWVALSACDTALGDVAAGEGVLGLQRAFRIAGARGLLLSLWSVPDRSAREWMIAAYEARLRGGLGAAASAREASLSMLRHLRARGLSDHPSTWGAFIATGDPR